ncbi:MAG: TlpA disulfide reductase family protein [Bacteroidales bacterium]
MKKGIIILVISTIFGCSEPCLKVEMGNFEKGTAYLFNTITQNVDTISFTGNTFSFEEKITEETLFKLYFEEIKNHRKPFYIVLSEEPTEIYFDSLKITDQKADSWSKLYPNTPVFIKDPNHNKSFYLYQDRWISFSDSILLLSADEDDFEKNKKYREELYHHFIVSCGEIISDHKSKLISAVILHHLIQNNLLDLSKIQEYYTLLSPEIQNSSLGKDIGYEASFKKNAQAPDFEITDMNGANYTLDSFRGKKLLLHFWSTTCAPCIEEIPLLLDLNNKEKNLIIINISLDNDFEKWKNGVYDLKMDEMINSFDTQGDKRKIAQDYFINAIPANYLISKHGKIIAKAESVEEILKNIK